MPDDVSINLEANTLVVTLNNPERRNALTPSMRAGIAEAISRSNSDEAVRVMVLTGAGGAFCSGADVRALSDRVAPPDAGTESRVRMVDMRERPIVGSESGGFDFSLLFWDMLKPTIAALSGPAVGAGFGLAMCCDLRVAATSAEAGVGFVRMGLSSEYGLSFTLPRVIGAARTFELMYTGRMLEASEMAEIGLVNRLVPDQELMGATLDLASRIASMPPLSVQRIRKAVHLGMESGSFHRQIEAEAYLQTLSLNSEDHKEGTRAFLEKRRPEWRGR